VSLQTKTKKIKTTMPVNGIDTEVEIEVPDIVASWGKKFDREYVGAPMPRVDGYDKVTGRAKYTFDINLPGMLFGAILRSPHAKAKILSIDLSKAEAMPGVRKAYAIKDAGANLRFAGDEIAAIAADSPEIAEDALRAILVKYEVLPHVVKEDLARKTDAPQVFGGQRPNVSNGGSTQRGDVDATFGSAKTTVSGEWRTQARVHACLETHGSVVQYQSDGTAKIWTSTQAVHGSADQFAGLMKLERSKLEVICQNMGGGFGSKFGPGVEGAVCARLAKECGRPVKLMLDRRGEAESAGNSPTAIVQAKLSANADGKITAIQGKAFGTGGIGGGGFEYPYGVYKIDVLDVARENVFTNLGPSNAMRAPGRPQSSFLTESGVDELAVACGIDPLAFRLTNETAEKRIKQFKTGAAAIGWKEKVNPTPGKNAKGPIVRGVGCAGSTWGGRGGNGQMKAEVRIATDGSVVVAVGTQDLGTGTRSYIRSIVADELGIDIKFVKSEIGSSKLPVSGASGGSTTTPTVAPSVKMAATQAKSDFLVALASATKEKLEKLTLLPGGSVSNGKKTLSWTDACKRLGPGGIVSQGTWNASLVQGPIHGAQFAEVEVDTETGKVRVKKLVVVQDGGVIMNRMLLTSQINGGLIQGLGFALTEERIACQNTGRMMNANLEEYKLPGTREIPEIQVILDEDDEAIGVSGVAEAPVIPTAAAIANAVFNASGARVRSLPITSAKVLAALGKVKANKANNA
jgi:xanthine dehydrogenase YagR molybdenum-binding subunit